MISGDIIIMVTMLIIGFALVFIAGIKFGDYRFKMKMLRGIFKDKQDYNNIDIITDQSKMGKEYTFTEEDCETRNDYIGFNINTNIDKKNSDKN